MNIRLTLEYDGTAYGGWQRQDNAVTVQQRVEEALKALTGKRHIVAAAGRTDAGVHALGQVCHFHTDAPIPPDRFAPALNTHLPPDIRAVESRQAAEDFHAQRDARGKHYRYTIFTRPSAPALDRSRAWHVAAPLDAPAMARAAAALVGTHDFRGFMDSGSPVKTTVRTLRRADVTAQGRFVILDFEGTGFLYHMARVMAGTLAEVGLGKRTEGSIRDILASADRQLAGVTAPAHGLCLVRVLYDGEEDF